MKTAKLQRLFFFLLAVAVVLFVSFADALASGDDDDVLAQADASATASASADAVANATMTGGDLIGGDTNVSTGGNRAFAVSHSLGDVDINDCIVSTQTGTFIVSWQGYDYNLWCMGEVFDAKGLFKMGAEMRCDIPPIAEKFDYRGDCLAANTVDQEITQSPELAQLYEQAARFEEQHREAEDEHDEELERVQMEQSILMERLDQYEHQLEQRQQPVIVQQEPAISEEDKQRAWEFIQQAKGRPKNE